MIADRRSFPTSGRYDTSVLHFVVNLLGFVWLETLSFTKRIFLLGWGCIESMNVIAHGLVM